MIELKNDNLGYRQESRTEIALIKRMKKVSLKFMQCMPGIFQRTLTFKKCNKYSFFANTWVKQYVFKIVL